MRIRSLTTCLVLVAAGLLVPATQGTAGAAAPVAVPGCGAVLTADAYLKTDLTCPGPNGVTIGANITLDLRGHKISGPGSAASNSAGVGIRSGLTVHLVNGTVQKWGTGIGFIDSDDDPARVSATVSHVSFTSNLFGASLGPYEIFSFTNSRFLNNARGITSSWYGQATVRASIFRGNQTGAYIDDSGLTMTTSIVEHNGIGLSCTEAGCHLDRNAIRNNNTGVSIGFIGSYTMTKNVISGNTVGVDSGGFTAADFRYNTFVRNKTGLNLSDSFGTIYRNSFIGNGVGLTSSNESNDVFGSATIEQNVARFNGDGFLITGVGDQLKSNTATRNHRWGINAPKAVDLGGNKASGNGNNPQCVGVVCR